NIGKEIALTDFSIEEVAPFKAILGPDSIPLIERIFYWTNGQPLMVQALTAKLCALSEEKRTVERLDTMVAATYLNTRIEKEMHLNFIRDYLLDKYHNPRKMLKTYQAVLNDGPVAHDKSALIHSRLLLSGVVRLENGYLKVRNRIYQRVFNRQWITENLPIDRVRIVAYLSSTTLLMVLLWFYLIQPLWFPKFITTQIYPWLQDDIYYVTQPEYHFSMQMPLDQPRRITINGEPYSSREPFDKSKGGEISFDFSKLQVGPNQFKVRFYGTLWQENFETDFVIVFFPSSHWKIPTGLEMVAVPAGCFDMGCGAWTNNCDEDEKPLHRVCLSAFKMGKFELTQAQWQALMGYNPSSFRDVPRLPVENISWQDTQEFLRRLNKITGLSYNLPTEAQWEYAARSAGRPEKYAGGDELNKLGWYGGNSNGRTHPVGSKDANGLGLYDMSGNVWEWCRDWYADDYYSNSPENNPTGPTTGSYRVFRGGPWSLSAGFCRAASRNRGGPGFRIIFLGFRLALFPGRQEASRQVGSAGRSRMEGRAVAGPESAVPVLPIQNESPVNINKRPEEK
ncbi:MAG: formylglycine-generating enzyme family protein, partial [Desulfobacteraceae bacterium]